MDSSVLLKFGLSKAEIKVYLILLQLGSAPSSRIIDETELRKSTVYESLKRLQQKGLVSHVIKEGLTYFQATEPEKIFDFVEDKKREIGKIEKSIKELIKEMRSVETLKPHAEARVLVGIEGFKTMRRDVLRNAGKEHLLIGAISRENEVMPEFFDYWNKERIKKKIVVRVLHKASAKEKKMTNKLFMRKYFETRFLPQEVESPAVINIYGDRVVNVLWKQKQPICFLLINKEIADSYRKYFEYLWKLAGQKKL